MSKDKGTKNKKKLATDKSKGKVLSDYQASKKPNQVTFMDNKDLKDKK